VKYLANFACPKVDTVPLFVKRWREYTQSRLKHVDEKKNLAGNILSYAKRMRKIDLTHEQ
jgi:hypothetical protein